MKFISKNANYRIVLKHGMPSEPLTGRAQVHGLYVKFENGVALVSNEETVKLMLSHPAFNKDFVSADGIASDPYKVQRGLSEPEHDIVNIEYGRVAKNINPKPKFNLTPEMNKHIATLATEMAKDMAISMTKGILENMVGKNEGQDKDVQTHLKQNDVAQNISTSESDEKYVSEDGVNGNSIHKDVPEYPKPTDSSSNIKESGLFDNPVPLKKIGRPKKKVTKITQ